MIVNQTDTASPTIQVAASGVIVAASLVMLPAVKVTPPTLDVFLVLRVLSCKAGPQDKGRKEPPPQGGCGVPSVPEELGRAGT